MNFSSVILSHGQQFYRNCYNMGNYSIGCTACSSEGPPKSHRYYQETCSGVDSCLYGSVGPYQEPAPAWVFHRVTASSRASTSSHVGLLHRLQVNLCTPIVLHGLQGRRCLTMVFTVGCRGISDPRPGASPFFTDLCACGVPLTCSHSVLL